MKRTILCLLAAVSIMANAEQTFKVTVENPTKDARTDAPVVIQLADMGIDVRSALVTEDGKEITCQLDDLNGDKRFDELCFTTNLGKREKKTFEVTLSDQGKPRQYESRVFIEMVLRNYQVKENVNNLDSSLDLELLFNAAIMNKNEISNLFK